MRVNGHEKALMSGHSVARLVAIRNPCLWPVVFLGWGLVQGDHSLAGEGLGEAVGVAFGDD
jgi:hypothetical protein